MARTYEIGSERKLLIELISVLGSFSELCGRQFVGKIQIVSSLEFQVSIAIKIYDPAHLLTLFTVLTSDPKSCILVD